MDGRGLPAPDSPSVYSFHDQSSGADGPQQDAHVAPTCAPPVSSRDRRAHFSSRYYLHTTVHPVISHGKLSRARNASKRQRLGIDIFTKDAFKDRRVRVKAHLSLGFGILLIADLIIYLVLAVTGKARGKVFNILSILFILAFLGGFCHSIIRMIILLQKTTVRGRRRRRVGHGHVRGRSGTAQYEREDDLVPERPFPVVMAVDEDEVEEGFEDSEKAQVRPPPPIYGNFRNSMRIHPALLYRVPIPPSPLTPTYDEAMSAAEQAVGLRPPSYEVEHGQVRWENEQTNESNEDDIHPLERERQQNLLSRVC